VSNRVFRKDRRRSFSTVLGARAPYALAIVKKSLGDAVADDRLARNVAAKVKPPTKTPPEITVWSPQELRTFLDSQREDRLYALWTVLGTCGLRRGEALALRWADLDGDRLHVRRALVPVRDRPMFTTPKSGKTRTVDLDPFTVQALREHRKRQAEERLSAGPDYQDHDLIFCHPNGKPLDPVKVSKVFARKVRASVLPVVRLHDLRHSHAAHLLAAGVHVRALQERLGHASASFSLDRYGHLLESVQPEAATKTAALVWGTP
jgi:integrase